MSLDGNLQKYETTEVVDFYKQLKGLEACETHLFDQHLKSGMSVLDMGVGGGRTTPYLSAIAGRYVGADYAEAMVEACRHTWPNLEFRHCDATEMSQFRDGEFDAVVFSFNGIDVIPNDAARARCLSETSRVLKPGGIFIFSSHNAKVLGVWPRLADAKPHQMAWRTMRSIMKSGSLARRAVSGSTFAAGQGYIRDPVHGGMDHYVSTPDTMRPQLERVGLHVAEVVGGHYPTVTSLYLTPWHYYACRKAGG